MCLSILKNGGKCLSSTVSDRGYFSTTFSKIEINFPGTFGHNTLHILFNPHDAHHVFFCIPAPHPPPPGPILSPIFDMHKEDTLDTSIETGLLYK